MKTQKAGGFLFLRKRLAILSYCLIVLFLLAGCATQRYGRLQTLTPSEADHLDCKMIAIEIDKANAFIKEVSNKDAEFTGRDVLGFLGDFGIGNAMEFSDAIESGTKRIEGLNSLKAKKGCT